MELENITKPYDPNTWNDRDIFLWTIDGKPETNFMPEPKLNWWKSFIRRINGKRLY